DLPRVIHPHQGRRVAAGSRVCRSFLGTGGGRGPPGACRRQEDPQRVVHFGKAAVEQPGLSVRHRAGRTQASLRWTDYGEGGSGGQAALECLVRAQHGEESMRGAAGILLALLTATATAQDATTLARTAVPDDKEDIWSGA